jgi:type III restriction enzyme
VPLKMARLKQWCQDINKAQQDKVFDFAFVDQRGFEKFRPKDFQELLKLFTDYKSG